MPTDNTHGTIFKLGTTAVARVGDINYTGMSRDTHDQTTHDTPDNYRDYLAGLKDGGEVSLNLVFDQAASSHQDLLAAFEDGQKHAVEISNSNVKWTANVIFTGIGPFEYNVDGIPTSEVSMKVCGKPTLAAPGA
jgi:predicted secreted protein